MVSEAVFGVYFVFLSQTAGPFTCELHATVIDLLISSVRNGHPIRSQL